MTKIFRLLNDLLLVGVEYSACSITCSWCLFAQKSGSGPLVSTFVRDSGVATSSRNTNKLDTRTLSFKRVTVRIEDEAATPKFSKAGNIETGVISISPIPLSRSNKGRSKDVYEVSILLEVFPTTLPVLTWDLTSIDGHAVHHFWRLYPVCCQ